MTWWTWPGLRGAVLEQIPGAIVDLGAGGCSLETSSQLATGTFGFVEIHGPNASLAEVARVCAVTERPGAAEPFLLRLEFLSIALPVCPAAGDRGTDAHGDALVGTGEKTGRSLTPVRHGAGVNEDSSPAIAQDAPESHGNSASASQGTPLANDLK